MNRDEFVIGLKKLNIDVTDEKLEKLNKYYELLIEYNNHTNLTRITERNEVYLKHFYDSLTIVRQIDLDSGQLLDIGTGAGFPGLVLKIFFPNLDIVLVDSLNKRIKFLNNIIDELDLKGIVAIHTRAEDYIKENRERFDIVTSRAVAKLNVLSELCLPFVKIDGLFIAMKADIKDELENSKNAIKILGGKIINIDTFNLPKENSIRTLISIKKDNKTSVKYPRKFNEINKKPL